MRALFVSVGVLLALGIGGAVQATAGATLTVTLAGGKPGEGEFVVGLFDGQENWLKQVVREARVPVDADGKAVVAFEDLPPGTFAISTYQDRNSNGKIDLILGVYPREPYAFSNAARGMFGPAKFQDAAFEIGADDQDVEIRFP